MMAELSEAILAFDQLRFTVTKGWRIKSAPTHARRLQKACHVAASVHRLREQAVEYGSVPRHPESLRHLTAPWLEMVDRLTDEACDLSLALVSAVKAGDWQAARILAGDGAGALMVARSYHGLLDAGEEVFPELELARFGSEGQR